MDFSKLLLLLFIIYEVKSECTLEIENEKKSPVLAIKHNNDELSPLKNVTATYRSCILKANIMTNQILVIACPGKNNKLSKYQNSNYLEAICNSNGILYLKDHTELQNRNLSCMNSTQPAKWPIQTFVTTDTEYGVGYQIGPNNLRLELYRAYFDSSEYRTKYVTHTMHPHSIVSGSSHCSNFKDADMIDDKKLFSGIHISNIYKSRHFINFYLNRFGKKPEQNISRGHLAPCADFILSAECRATFDYINAAPQWPKNNQREWRVLEMNLRKQIITVGSEVIVYTGTSRTLSIRATNGILKNVSLNFNFDINRNVVPVPLYFYKVVYDPAQKTAAAFVSINYPSNDTSYVKQNYIFCENICNKMTWLNWIESYPSFCCTYDEFSKFVPDIVLPSIVKDNQLWSVGIY